MFQPLLMKSSNNWIPKPRRTQRPPRLFWNTSGSRWVMRVPNKKAPENARVSLNKALFVLMIYDALPPTSTAKRELKRS